MSSGVAVRDQVVCIHCGNSFAAKGARRVDPAIGTGVCRRGKCDRDAARLWDFGVRTCREAWTDPREGFNTILHWLASSGLSLYRYMDPEMTEVDVYEFRPDMEIDDTEGGLAPCVKAEEYRPGFDKQFAVHLFASASDALVLVACARGVFDSDRRRLAIGEAPGVCAVLVADEGFALWDHRGLQPTVHRM